MTDFEASASGRKWLQALVMAALCAALGGCSTSALSRGADFYTQKRYIDAAQVFEHSEPQLSAYSEAEQARYGLYRGATLLALGDVDDAERWLTYGARIAKHALSDRERAQLVDGLVSTQLSPGLSVHPASGRAMALLLGLTHVSASSASLAPSLSRATMPPAAVSGTVPPAAVPSAAMPP